MDIDLSVTQLQLLSKNRYSGIDTMRKELEFEVLRRL